MFCRPKRKQEIELEDTIAELKLALASACSLKEIAENRVKELEEENRRLKKMYAEERLKADILKEAIEKKW